jgi:hypothetical protein
MPQTGTDIEVIMDKAMDAKRICFLNKNNACFKVSCKYWLMLVGCGSKTPLRRENASD